MSFEIDPFSARTHPPHADGLHAAATTVSVSIRRAALVDAGGKRGWTCNPASAEETPIIELAWVLEVKYDSGNPRRIARRSYASARSDAHTLLCKDAGVHHKVFPASAEDWRYDVAAARLVNLESRCP